jgi:hypothetical protein
VDRNPTWRGSWMLLDTLFPVEKGLLARPWRMLCTERSQMIRGIHSHWKGHWKLPQHCSKKRNDDGTTLAPPVTWKNPTWQNPSGPQESNRWKCIKEVPTLLDTLLATRFSGTTWVSPGRILLSDWWGPWWSHHHFFFLEQCWGCFQWPVQWWIEVPWTPLS